MTIVLPPNSYIVFVFVFSVNTPIYMLMELILLLKELMVTCEKANLYINYVPCLL